LINFLLIATLRITTLRIDGLLIERLLFRSDDGFNRTRIDIDALWFTDDLSINFLWFDDKDSIRKRLLVFSAREFIR
jgi:hypothetical protein